MLPLKTLTFDDLGGIQTGKAKTNYLPRDAITATGGYFDVAGSFIRRKGGKKLNTTALGTASNFIFDHRFSGGQQVLIASGTSVFAAAPDTQVANFGAAIKTGLSAGGNFDFVRAQDYAFFCNEIDGLFKVFQGATVTDAGIVRPAAAPGGSAVASGGTLADGTYLVRFTYISDSDANETIESNPSNQLSLTIAGGGGSGSLSLTGITVGPDAQTTKRNIHVSAVDGAVLSFNSVINDNTTTTFIVTTDSAGALTEFDHDPPPTGLKKLAVFRNRLVGINNNVVFWSKEFKPWYWPQGDLDATIIHTFTIGDEDLTSIAPFFEEMLITMTDDVWVMSGTDELSFRIDRIRSDERRGCVSKRGLKIIGNVAYMIGRNSIYMTDRTKVYDAGAPLQDYFDQNSDDSVNNINKNSLSNSILEYDEEKNLLMMFVPTSTNTVNNMCWVMDTDSVGIDPQTKNMTADWSQWSGFVTEASAFVRESGQDRWYRADDSGYIFQQDQFDGDGSNITSTSTGSNTSTTLNDTTQSLTVNLYSGLRINIIAGRGEGQERIIASNTATEFTVTVAWDSSPDGIPDTTSDYAIGGIPFAYDHFWNNYGNPTISKRWRYARPRFDTTGNFTIATLYGFDFSLIEAATATVGLASATLWDTALWDVANWDGIFVTQTRLNIPGNHIHKWSQFGISDDGAGRPIRYNGVDVMFQTKGVR